MEDRFGSILLNSMVVIGLTISASVVQAETPSLDQIQEVEAVIQPEVNRIEFDESKISKGDFEVIPAVGLLSIEDFGANIVINVKLNYHLSEDVFMGFEIGRSNAGQTSYEVLSASPLLLSDEDRQFTYYLFNVGYNILPGEAYLTRSITYNNALYVSAGMGSVKFAGDNRLAITLGVGYRLMLFNYSSLYIELRDHTYNLDVLGVSKLSNSFEMNLGYSFYF